MTERSAPEKEPSHEEALKCLDRICPPEQRLARAARVLDCVDQLKGYRDFLRQLEKDEDCAALRKQLPDRAFAAEGALRVAIAEGIKSLNDLRDSGVLSTSFAE